MTDNQLPLFEEDPTLDPAWDFWDEPLGGSHLFDTSGMGEWE